MVRENLGVEVSQIDIALALEILWIQQAPDGNVLPKVGRAGDVNFEPVRRQINVCGNILEPKNRPVLFNEIQLAIFHHDYKTSYF